MFLERQVERMCAELIFFRIGASECPCEHGEEPWVLKSAGNLLNSYATVVF